MTSDRYTKTMLTVIAALLAWKCLMDATPPVAAQAAPQRVIIVGLEPPLTGLPVLPVDQSGAPVAVKGQLRALVANDQIRVAVSGEPRVWIAGWPDDAVSVRLSAISRRPEHGAWESIPVDVVKSVTPKLPGH